MSQKEERILRTFSVPGEKRGMERRLRIIRATIDSLATLGIQDTTFDSVGKLAKMQRSHIAYYYKTREELLDAAIKFTIASAQEVTVELIQNADSPKKRLEAMVRAAFVQAERFPKHSMVLTLLWNLANIDSAYRLFHTQMRQMGAERVEHVLELMFDSNQLEPSDKRTLAKTIQAITFGFLLEALSTDSFKSLKEAENLAVAAVFRLLTLPPIP